MKETNFFIAERGWPRGVQWYESLFAGEDAMGATAVGEASPNYTMYPAFGGVPERMAGLIPSTRYLRGVSRFLPRGVVSQVWGAESMSTSSIEVTNLLGPSWSKQTTV